MKLKVFIELLEAAAKGKADPDVSFNHEDQALEVEMTDAQEDCVTVSLRARNSWPPGTP